MDRMSTHRRDVAPKHRKKSRRLAPALWVGGFLLLGVAVFFIATADPADPLDRPNVVPGGLAPADFQERVSVAQATSRDSDRLERYQQQIREAKRREARAEARKEARKEAREAAKQAAIEESTSDTTTPVVGSGSSSKNTKTSSGILPDLLLFIRANESGGNYGAYNGAGCEGYGCFGAYQLHGAYMDDWARRYGAAAYASIPANRWPPAVQDKVALGLFYSTNPDGAHWCNWTSYC